MGIRAAAFFSIAFFAGCLGIAWGALAGFATIILWSCWEYVVQKKELDAHYCDVILTRWEKLTGKTAVKLSDN